jgi:hypothetical protein
MIREMMRLSVFIVWSIVIFIIFVFPISATLIDMRDVMHSRYKENEQKGSLKKFPEWTLNGNLYEKAHAMAELQLVHPALQALDLTYEVIADRCNEENIFARDITNVFAQSNAGQQFRMMLDAREMVSTVKDAWFDKSCLAVYACYNKDELTAQWVDISNIKLSDQVYRSCTTTVDDLFMVMYHRASSLESMKNVNYGDEFLVNGDPDDGPYDLLLDIQAIGDILFTHNDGPSVIHFYDMDQVWTYGTNDPERITSFETNDPKEKERTERRPVTSGVTPSVPQEAQQIFPPISKSSQSSFNWWWGWWTAGWWIWQGVAQQSLMIPLQPNSLWPSAQAVGEQLWNTISNVLCELPLEEVVEEEDVLTLAKQENEQTNIYNTKLDLDEQVAIMLASKMSTEEEEQLWATARGGGENHYPPAEDPERTPEAEETTKAIFDQLLDIDWTTLDDIKERIQTCVEQFTDADKWSRSKVLLKSITQPALFTKCVFGHLCKEIGDPTGRGMFRIKVCRELRKGSWLVSNQTIKSAEEVIDEMLNVCTTLKESGALLEHNKTKDHLEDKLMRIDFGNKFAFGVSVIFKGSRDAIDPATVKLRAIEQREYLEKVHLRITNNLTFIEERNRYLVMAWWMSSWFEWDPLLVKRNQAQIEKNVALLDEIYYEGVAANNNIVANQLQLNTSAWIIGLIQDFVIDNIEMRKTANQYTDSMNKRWATTLKLYQASPN